jgi:hypothetical protein
MSVKARSSFPILTTQGPRGCRFSQRLETELPRYGRVFKKKFPDAKGIGETPPFGGLRVDDLLQFWRLG